MFDRDPLWKTGGLPIATGDDATLLIYAPVPLHRSGGVLFQEDQACNGLRLWAEHFPKLLVMMPLAAGPPPPNWVPVGEVGANLSRIEIHPLPAAYRPDRFLRHLGPVRQRIRALIRRADYLSFSIGGLFGDWGSVACLTAHGMGRPFAVWTDRVESQVVRHAARTGPLKTRLKARLLHRPMAGLERHIVRNAALGLFHGRDTYDRYAPHSREPHLVHDIHLRAEDHICAARLQAKMAAAGQGPLGIVYAGRADPMKGPLDWVETLRRLAAAGVAFTATWLGDGTEHAEMTRRIAAAGLQDRVTAPGHVADRARVLETLRDADLFLFCHQTPESPRCLIEALASGTPIVGYDNAYAADLVSGQGGGRLVPVGDIGALAGAVRALAERPAALADLIARARRDGAPYTDEAVFRHRSEVIKTYL